MASHESSGSSKSRRSDEAPRALLDVNVLIALHDAQHVHHRLASEWFVANVAAGWASCPLTENGCIRVMSQPGYANPVSIGAALGLLKRSCAASVHAFWPDDLSVLDETRLLHAHLHGHRQLTDVYLLALAVRHGGRFVTFDARVPVSAVHGAAKRHLLAL